MIYAAECTQLYYDYFKRDKTYFLKDIKLVEKLSTRELKRSIKCLKVTSQSRAHVHRGEIGPPGYRDFPGEPFNVCIMSPSVIWTPRGWYLSTWSTFSRYKITYQYIINIEY